MAVEKNAQQMNHYCSHKLQSEFLSKPLSKVQTYFFFLHWPHYTTHRACSTEMAFAGSHFGINF